MRKILPTNDSPLNTILACLQVASHINRVRVCYEILWHPILCSMNARIIFATWVYTQVLFWISINSIGDWVQSIGRIEDHPIFRVSYYIVWWYPEGQGGFMCWGTCGETVGSHIFADWWVYYSVEKNLGAKMSLHSLHICYRIIFCVTEFCHQTDWCWGQKIL